jgi:hypothetical protein
MLLQQLQSQRGDQHKRPPRTSTVRFAIAALPSFPTQRLWRFVYEKSCPLALPEPVEVARKSSKGGTYQVVASCDADTDQSDRANARTGDKAASKTVFDNGRAGFIFEKAQEKSFHRMRLSRFTRRLPSSIGEKKSIQPNGLCPVTFIVQSPLMLADYSSDLEHNLT